MCPSRTDDVGTVSQVKRRRILFVVEWSSSCEGVGVCGG